MRSGLATGILVFAALALAFALHAQAEDGTGFYIGAGVVRGETQAESPGSSLSGGFAFREQSTSWKGMIGVRPLSLLGAELEYVDFGSTTSGQTTLGAITGDLAATSVFGLFYLPLPAPFLDLYAKAGYARLAGDVVTAPGGTTTCFATPPTPWYCSGSSRIHLDDHSFATGLGIQVRVSAVTIRAEYEIFMPSGPNPRVYSLTLQRPLL
jgi:hypothetical protein